MNNNLTMAELYSKLSKLGFSKEFIRSIGLPSWWVDELDEKNTAVYEAAGYISNRLLIDLTSLIDVSQEAKFISNMCYKEIIYILEQRKECLVELKRLGTDILSNDANDYFEQLLTLEI